MATKSAKVPDWVQAVAGELPGPIAGWHVEPGNVLIVDVEQENAEGKVVVKDHRFTFLPQQRVVSQEFDAKGDDA